MTTDHPAARAALTRANEAAAAGDEDGVTVAVGAAVLAILGSDPVAHALYVDLVRAVGASG